MVSAHKRRTDVDGEQQTLGLAGPRISRITIGRLHNLGSYEHVRYEVTVELPPGTSPTSVLDAVSSTLDELEPKPPVDTWQLREADKLLKQPEPTLQACNDDDPFSDPQADLRRARERREEARRTVERYEAWRQRRAAALKRFDEFGGTTRFGGGRDEEGDA